MKKIIIVGMLVFVSIASIAQDKWNLERCVEHALQNNINIKQSELNVALVEQNVIWSIDTTAEGQWHDVKRRHILVECSVDDVDDGGRM